MTTRVPYSPLLVEAADVAYLHGPDSQRRKGVPSGETVEFEWNHSVIRGTGPLHVEAELYDVAVRYRSSCNQLRPPRAATRRCKYWWNLGAVYS